MHGVRCVTVNILSENFASKLTLFAHLGATYKRCFNTNHLIRLCVLFVAVLWDTGISNLSHEPTRAFVRRSNKHEHWKYNAHFCMHCCSVFCLAKLCPGQ